MTDSISSIQGGSTAPISGFAGASNGTTPWVRNFDEEMINAFNGSNVNNKVVDNSGVSVWNNNLYKTGYCAEGLD